MASFIKVNHVVPPAAILKVKHVAATIWKVNHVALPAAILKVKRVVTPPAAIFESQTRGAASGHFEKAKLPPRGQNKRK
jgi:hypothetical protein